MTTILAILFGMAFFGAFLENKCGYRGNDKDYDDD